MQESSGERVFHLIASAMLVITDDITCVEDPIGRRHTPYIACGAQRMEREDILEQQSHIASCAADKASRCLVTLSGDPGPDLIRSFEKYAQRKHEGTSHCFHGIFLPDALRDIRIPNVAPVVLHVFPETAFPLSSESYHSRFANEGGMDSCHGLLL